MTIKFADVEIGEVFFYTVSLWGRCKFMKIQNLLDVDSAMNTVWLTRNRGKLCHFDDTDEVEVEVWDC